MSQVAEMGRFNTSPAVLVAVGAVGLWLLTRRPAPPDQVGGLIGDPGGIPGVSLSRLGGSITAVNVSQGAQMGRHLLTKVGGSFIQADITVEVDARAANGNAIPWTYRIETRLGHSTFFGWRESGRLGFSDSGERLSPSFLWEPGLHSHMSGFAAPNDPDQEWDIHVRLLALAHDETGIPLQSWVELARMDHDGAVRTVQNSVSVSGSFPTDGVLVSQADIQNWNPRHGRARLARRRS